MEKVYPGHDVLSVLCPPIKTRTKTFGALTEKILSKGLLISIVSAFLIVLIAAISLRLASTAIENKVALSTAQAQVEQKVGWLPGSYIEQELNSGYYR